MSTHLNPDHTHGLDVLAAVQTLRADAAPLAAALVRAGRIALPEASVAPMLALLDGLGYADTAAGTKDAQRAMLAAWSGAQGRESGSPGEPAVWDALAGMGLAEQAHAAVVFALSVAYAGAQRASSGEAGQALH
jgi:hypothetical protein